MLLRNRFVIVLAALLCVVAGIVACSGVSVNGQGNTTPVATVQLQLPALAPTTQFSGLTTRAPPTKQSRTPSQPEATRRSLTPTLPAKVNGFQTIAYNTLPPEAKKTLALIESDGPYPYRQDGQVFQNREGILPKKSQNYYHEYTVVTPGSDDRGARRIIAGDQGELFYTDDHYSSFKVILNNE